MILLTLASIFICASFVEIDWDTKIMELDGGTIDCVWNGMTLTDEVKSAMNCSKAYCNNAQIVVDKIANTPTDYSDRPYETQQIQTMTVDTLGEEYAEPETL